MKSHQDWAFTVSVQTLESTVEQRGFSVQAQSTLKVASQVGRVVKKAFAILTFISEALCTEVRMLCYSCTR